MNDSTSNRTALALVLILLAIGMALRLAAIRGDLPWIAGPDEGFEIHRALRLGQGDVDLERVSKGGFFYVLFVEYGLYYGWLRLTDAVGSPSDFAARFATDITPFWMIARVTHAVVAGLVILWTYLLGRRAYDWRAGVIGAAVVTVSTIHVSHAHHVGVDLPMTLLALATLWLAVDWAREARPCRPIAAGFLYGAAMATKIPAAILGIPLLVAQWLRHHRTSTRRALFGQSLLVAFIVAALTFVLGQPGVIYDARELFLVDIPSMLFGRSLVHQPVQETPYTEPGLQTNLWAFYFGILARDLRLPVLLLVVAGLAHALASRKRADLVLLSFVLPLFALVASVQTTNLYYPRYLMPVIPIVSILAGRSLVAAADQFFAARRAASRWSPQTAMWAPLAFAALAASPMLVRSVAWVERYSRDDSRILARGWFEANVPPGSRVFLIGDPLGHGSPALSLPITAIDPTVPKRIANDPVKTEYLRLRATARQEGAAYDLRTARHFEPVRSLNDYAEEGVEYFVLTGDHFGAERLERDRKHGPRILESRRQLVGALESHPGAALMFRLDPQLLDLQGPSVEVYRLRPSSEPMLGGAHPDHASSSGESP